MIGWLIRWSVDNRALVLILSGLLLLGGVLSVKTISLDAIPDLSDVQVIVFTEYPGQAPQVVEDQVTYPLTTAMLAVPQAKVVRGYSFFGLSFVYIIFEDGTDMYWARSRVLEYLNFVSGQLPAGVTPQLGPDATGVGWAFQYALVDDTGRHDLADLRSLQDWTLRYELMSVPGVAEVASLGGFVKQYQVEVDPVKLLAYDIPIQKVRQAIQRSNEDVGGRLIERAETEYMVRGLGYLQGVEDLKQVPLGVDAEGVPILLGNLARITEGPELRRGLAELDGEGEVVGGIVIVRFGANPYEVIQAVKAKLRDFAPSLPAGVQVLPVYDRTDLIERAVETLEEKLIEEMIVVAVVCVVFLLHVRSAFVAILVVPLGVLLSFVVMRTLGIGANIMSLGGLAIAIGAMVDASVVMVENAHKHLERDVGQPRLEVIKAAAVEVGPPLFYSLVIITVSFLPVFSLTGQSGRLFKPLAFTKTFAMAGSALLAVTLVPALMHYLIRGRIPTEARNPLSRFFIAAYRPLIRGVLRYRKTTLALSAVALAVTLWPASRLGSEFMPPLNEGDILYMPTTDPGISITKAKELLQQTDKILRRFPEVERVFGKVGRAETATDPAPLSMIETVVTLKPVEEWPDPDKDIQALMEEMDAAIRFPGVTNAWTMPIKTRIDMLSTGIKTPVGVKVLGPDLEVLSRVAAEVAGALRELPGTLSAFPEKSVGGYYYDYRIDRGEAARYGLTVADVQEVITSAIGGMNVTYTVEGLERYPVNVRYPRELRNDRQELLRVLVPTPTGAQVPLGQLVEFEVRRGPPSIKTENARKSAWIYVDLRDVDVGTYVERAQAAIARLRATGELELPVGYTLVWSGQYQYMQEAWERLRIVIPLTLLAIFLLLYVQFESLWRSLLVMLSLPFAVVGGVWLIYLLGYNTSVAVYVGFIALAGLAAQTAVVMLVYLDAAHHKREQSATLRDEADLHAAIMEGAVDRVRPKLMTVATMLFGLLPIMIATATGARVMKRIAAPMVGGLVTSTVLTLVIVPVIYAMVQGWRLRRRRAREERPPAVRAPNR